MTSAKLLRRKLLRSSPETAPINCRDRNSTRQNTAPKSRNIPCFHSFIQKALKKRIRPRR
jgi:hypothetical protein